MSDKDRDQADKNAKLLECYSLQMRRTFTAEALLEIGTNNIVDVLSDVGVSTYFHISFKEDIIPGIPPQSSWGERYKVLRKFGVTDEKIEDLERLRQEWVSAFHLTEDQEHLYLMQYKVESQLLDIASGATDIQSSTTFTDVPPKTRFYKDSDEALPRPPPVVLHRRVGAGGSRKQALTPDKELWFPTALEFRSWLLESPTKLRGFGDETFFDDDNLGGNAYLRRVGSHIEVAAMYHGVNLGRYKKMLWHGGFERLLSRPQGDLSPESALYFSNDPMYALAWAVLKATSGTHLNTPFERLTGIVIMVNFSPKAETMDGISAVRPEVAEEYMMKSSSTDVSETEWYGWDGIDVGKMIVGPFFQHHLAELEGITSKKSLGTKGKLGVQWSSRAHEYLEDIDSLRQIAVLDREGQDWLDKSDFKVCFVGMGSKVEEGTSKAKAHSAEKTAAEQYTAQTTPTFFEL
ncbi:hypothetical protein TWF696_004056 [Orbilia brochopaga]|uniref:Uncharacterized protein n=1 Tax=Orbilia brochopaga TaxID=3140254 RepID=A0AAV9V871_9PEZI